MMSTKNTFDDEWILFIFLGFDSDGFDVLGTERRGASIMNNDTIYPPHDNG